jgi:hypothetical protein
MYLKLGLVFDLAGEEQREISLTSANNKIPPFRTSV